ncbi:MAG: rod shape-determining protein RodA [Gammaproteobacteria bacterium]|nr:rod shape-determining protein RodA [Gammaproteobacteria bacterium]
MSYFKIRGQTYEDRIKQQVRQLRWSVLHIDPWLTIGIILLASTGLMILYSASNESLHVIVSQSLRFGLAFILMFVCAQISPRRYLQWAPWLYGFGIILLLLTSVAGHTQMGARRWLKLGPIHLQPSEIMKLALPLMLAWYYQNKSLPPKFKPLLISVGLLLLPIALVIKQPDLGTAILIAIAGISVLLFAGMSWRLILGLTSIVMAALPFCWHFMHQYQRNRVLTFLNPERDPLGNGYHIIQSKIAIGSGGFLGKGWLAGTQSHLSFLPAHATDFIFAVNGEELGLIGCILLLAIFLLIFARCLYISWQAQDTFSRLLSASLSVSFISMALVNIGMVIGILPVVGVPLPLISYGGSSMVTIMIQFGIITSIHTHRKLWAS